MNLKSQYKRLFEGRVSSNDRKLLKEASADRDAIAHFIWGRDEFMDNSEQEIERIIDDLEEEWMAVKGNYSDVMKYLDELEDTGGLEGYMNEGKARSNDQKILKEDYSTMRLKSNIDKKWSDKQDMIDDMSQWLESVYAAGGANSEDTYDDIIEALRNLLDNFEPSEI